MLFDRNPGYQRRSAGRGRKQNRMWNDFAWSVLLQVTG